MKTMLERLMDCGVDKERAKMIINYHGTVGKWEDLENYIIVLEMHKKGED